MNIILTQKINLQTCFIIHKNVDSTSISDNNENIVAVYCQ